MGARLHVKTALGTGLACGRRKPVGFPGLCRCTMVQGYNTDVNDRRCAGGFVRVRGRCLGAVGSQSLQRYEGFEMTKGNDVMAASLKTVSAWRGLFF